MGNDTAISSEPIEAQVAGYVAAFFSRLGIEVFTQETALPGRKNVGGILSRGATDSVVLLLTHMDTVGGDEQLFVPRVQEGRMFGRGACDAKGSLAAMLAAVADWCAHPTPLTDTVIVLAVVDEEWGGTGCRALLAQAPTEQARLAIIGEPTESRLVYGYKGLARWMLHTEGSSCHSSHPESGSGDLTHGTLVALEQYANELTDLQIELLGAETLCVGTITGGTAINVVPDHCRISIDRRLAAT